MDNKNRLTGKAHRNVARDMKVTLHQAGLKFAGFGQREASGNNNERIVYHLPRRELPMLVAALHC